MSFDPMYLQNPFSAPPPRQGGWQPPMTRAQQAQQASAPQPWASGAPMMGSPRNLFRQQFPGHGSLPNIDRGESVNVGYSSGVQNQTPWDPQQPFIYDLFRQAKGVGDTPLGYYGGDSYAPTTRLSQRGYDAAGGLFDSAASQGPGQGYLEGVLSGQYLDQGSNPALRALADQGAADITRQYQTAIAPTVYRRGNIGSGSEANRMRQAQIGLGDALSRNYANTYGADYARERGFMQQAPGMLQDIYGGRRADVGLGSQISQYGQDYAERVRSADQTRFDFLRDEPFMRMGRYQQGILGAGAFGNVSATQSQTAGYDRNFKPPSGGGTSAGQWAGLGIGAASLFMSTRTAKEHLSAVDPIETLGAMRNLEVAIWRYLPEIAEQKNDYAWHMGPYAEDFNQVFSLSDGRMISFIDILGATIASVQGVALLNDQLAARATELEGALADYGERLVALEGEFEEVEGELQEAG